MPVTTVHFTAKHSRTFVISLCHFLLQRLIAVGNLLKNSICFTLPAYEKSHKLNPFSLSQRVEFLKAEMWHKRHTSLLDGIITTSFEWRYEDHIRFGSHHQFRIKVAFHTYFHNITSFDTSLDLLIKEIFCTRNTLHHLRSVKDSKV